MPNPITPPSEKPSLKERSVSVRLGITPAQREDVRRVLFDVGCESLAEFAWQAFCEKLERSQRKAR